MSKHTVPIRACVSLHRPPRTLNTRPSFRCFCISTPLFLRSTELKPEYLSSLRSNADRIWSDIHTSADKFGPGRRYGSAPEETGLTRLTLTDHDKAARDWFAETTKSLNCDVKVDSIGNMFAIRPGLKNDVPATFVGSHLDSQPLGGRFDGVLGVIAGIEMLRVLDENHIETEGPVGVVNWTNEEGARFPVSMMGSGVWAGVQDLNKIYDLEDVNSGKNGERSRTVKEELERIGYLGSMPASATKGIKMGGHFELHIEQGPKLTSTGDAIGAVQGVQAYQWYAIQVYGEASHAGATEFKYRSDALLFASEIVIKAREMAVKAGVLATVGILRAEPGSVNTVPDSAYLTLDIRHPNNEMVQKFATDFQQWIKSAEQEHQQAAKKELGQEMEDDRGIRVEIRKTFENAATLFDEVALNCVRESAKAVTEKTDVQNMTSGAGHDSVNTNKHCPTAMVFVPCRRGISHHPEEWCKKEHCAIGTDVILQSVLRFDQWRHAQGHFID